MTWLLRQLKKLVATESRYKDKIDKIASIHGNVFNEFAEWTPLKLVFLHYVLAIYTAIIHKYFKHMYYVDLFAGSGINKTKKGKYCLIGSPFIAVLNHSDKYDKFFFCERNADFAEVLDKRLDAIDITNKQVFPKDCNLEIDKILAEIKDVRDKHILFFIDPFALDFNWKSMQKVLETRSDIIFTFMTTQIVRAWKSALARPGYDTEKLNALYGDTSWKKAVEFSDLLGIYKENILNIRKKGIIETVEVKGNGFHYHVLFITTETKGGNKWLGGIKTAKKEIEQNSEDAVRVSLEIIARKQSELSTFCN